MAKTGAESGDKCDDSRHDGPDDREDFPIREFPDMRDLRCAGQRTGEHPVDAGAADGPSPDESEEDFGLKRSTREEALQFLRDIIAVRDAEAQDEDDPLTEFLDDE